CYHHHHITTHIHTHHPPPIPPPTLFPYTTLFRSRPETSRIISPGHTSKSAGWTRHERSSSADCNLWSCRRVSARSWWKPGDTTRSEEHTSELQSRFDLVCRLPLEKKKVTKEW